MWAIEIQELDVQMNNDDDVLNQKFDNWKNYIFFAFSDHQNLCNHAVWVSVPKQ